MIATSRIRRIPPPPAPPATAGDAPDDAELLSVEADEARTATEKRHDAVLPLASLATYVTLCTPIEMLPDSKMDSKVCMR